MATCALYSSAASDVYKRQFLCFDIGGSKYNVGLLRQDGTILARQKSLWHGHTQQEMLAELFCAGHAVLALSLIHI